MTDLFGPWHVRFVSDSKNVDLREGLAVLALLAAIACEQAGGCGTG